MDKLLQPIAKQQESYLKDLTDFINFIEKMRVPNNAILVSRDVTSLYTNIPQEEMIETVCRAYESFYEGESPIPTQYLKRALQAYTSRKLIPVHWKKLPPNAWNSCGY